MTKKLVSVILSLVMLFACALPAFAATISASSAVSAVEGKIWAKSDTTVYTSPDEEETEDYRVVHVENNGVKFVFHVSNYNKPVLQSYETIELSGLNSYISLLNAILLKISALFE